MSDKLNQFNEKAEELLQKNKKSMEKLKEKKLERREKEQELADLEEQIKHKSVAVNIGSKGHNEAQLQKFKEKRKNLQDELQDIEEQIISIEQGKAETLQKIYQDDLEELYRDIENEVYEEMNSNLPEFRRLKAEYLQQVYELGQPRERQEQARKKLEQVYSVLGVGEKQKLRKKSLPEPNLVNKDVSIDQFVGISTQEAFDWYTHNFRNSLTTPLYLRHYIETGDLLHSEQQVKEKQKEERQKKEDKDNDQEAG
ncbi:hypothetical protein SAMN05216353_11757 [Halobacillus alkaliphilus]|uniref:Uncharacterized protein n=1 Tax=Halobacillus alkaliphilus TaxID=396056 RepID=A0A1I2N7C4_9BACI|nr:hypothetical protein [Halobacillus alkaliphilus]SFF98990.1 hypothetical protein SAMN05216353_11757 [Halobacillus alkaliphilus]